MTTMLIIMIRNEKKYGYMLTLLKNIQSELVIPLEQSPPVVTGPVLGGAGPNTVLCKTCSVLLCVQPRVDNSSAWTIWEQLVQLA